MPRTRLVDWLLADAPSPFLSERKGASCAVPHGGVPPIGCSRSRQERKRKVNRNRKWIAGPAMAGLLLVGTASVADAAAPAQTEEAGEDNNSNAGLFGLLGLAGLAGLAGLKRRDTDRRNDQRRSGTSSTRNP